MILNAGQRTDIVAFYTPWLLNRLREGYVLVRNPYNPQSITRYSLDPAVVDIIGFCTKNPAPILPHLDALEPYGQHWFVTITPYGRDIEPFVPPKRQVIACFQQLSASVGLHRVAWRYDPILLWGPYTVDYHLSVFAQMAEALQGYTRTVVISFVDLYTKTRRAFPGLRACTREERLTLGQKLAEIAHAHGMTIKACAEGQELAPYGVDCGGCMTVAAYEAALGCGLKVPAKPSARAACACYLGGDIGAYNSCGHLCRYCYANDDPATIQANRQAHDPASPLLIGHVQPGDVIHTPDQATWKDGQLRLEL